MGQRAVSPILPVAVRVLRAAVPHPGVRAPGVLIVALMLGAPTTIARVGRAAANRHRAVAIRAAARAPTNRKLPEKAVKAVVKSVAPRKVAATGAAIKSSHITIPTAAIPTA